MMKKLFLLLVLGATALTSWGQTSQRVKECVADIRKQYAVAKERISREQKEEFGPKEDMTTVLHYIIPGCGLTTEKLYFCLQAEDADDSGLRFYHPLLITRSYNVAARQMYEEYLYDSKSGRLIFAFFQHDNFEGSKAETRYYFDKDGLAWEDIRGERALDEVFAIRKGDYLKNVVSLLINSGD